MRIHKAFLVLWLLDLIFTPMLVILDLAFPVGIESNYLMRFSYIAAFLLAIFYISFAKKGGIVCNRLVIIFAIVLVVGSLKGIIQGSLNSSFLAHIFYVSMPIVLISYGWHFFECYEQSHWLQNYFSKSMYAVFYFGIIAVVLFQVGYQIGLAKYDAIGIWNFAFSGPYLLYQQNGLIYFGLSIFGTLVSGKRGYILLFIVFIIIYIYLLNRKDKLKFIIFLLTGAFFFSFLFVDELESSLGRVYRTLDAVQRLDFDVAFAKRWSESISAIEHLSSRIDHFLFGAGFGAEFLPWPDIPDYETYYSHYTHISFISYIWIGGLFFSSYLYLKLFSLSISLLRGVKAGLIERKYIHFVYWLFGILTISFAGADLMNNPYLWFIIGCCLNLNRRCTFHRNLNSVSSH